MPNCQLCKCFRNIHSERLAFARPAGIDAATLFGERLSAGFEDDDDDDDWEDDDWDYDDDYEDEDLDDYYEDDEDDDED